MMLRVLISIALLDCLPALCVAWDGSDFEGGTSVEIERGNLVRVGNDVEIYDSNTGEYHDVTLDGITRYGSTVELEVYDHTAGESRTLEMED